MTFSDYKTIQVKKFIIISFMLIKIQYNKIIFGIYNKYNR